MSNLPRRPGQAIPSRVDHRESEGVRALYVPEVVDHDAVRSGHHGQGHQGTYFRVLDAGQEPAGSIRGLSDAQPHRNRGLGREAAEGEIDFTTPGDGHRLGKGAGGGQDAREGLGVRGARGKGRGPASTGEHGQPDAEETKRPLGVTFPDSCSHRNRMPVRPDR